MEKLSKSEAGKLGANAARDYQRITKQLRVDVYNVNPTLCALCETALPYEKRKNKFCSQSCGARFNNSGLDRWAGKRSELPSKHRMVDKECRRCAKPIRVKESYLFCGNSCASKHKSETVISDWLAGLIESSSGVTLQLRQSIRRYLVEKAGGACSICGWAKRHPVDGKPLVEVDHIDGNAANGRPENLRVLCPNCHSETPTFRARNPKSARVR